MFNPPERIGTAVHYRLLSHLLFHKRRDQYIPLHADSFARILTEIPGRMLKKPASLFSYRSESQRTEESLSDVGITGEAFPFAKIHCMGKRPTQSAVCTSSLTAAALTAFLNILQECSPVAQYSPPKFS
jgi:hypothetical protein